VNFREITNKDGFPVTYEGNKNVGSGLPPGAASGVRLMDRYPSTVSIPHPDMPVNALPRYQGMAVENATLNRFRALLRQTVLNERLVFILSQLAKAVSEFKTGSPENAIVLGWFITETILNEKWSSWLSNLKIQDPSRISADRAKTLKGRDFTSAIKLNTMELSGVISKSEFQEFDWFRKQRNTLVHQLDHRVDIHDAQRAIRVVHELLKQHFSIEFEINMALSLAGI
jgi:hypothetical protein